MVQAPKPSSSREKVDGPEEPAQQVFRGTGGSAERRGRDKRSVEKTREPGVKRNETMLFVATRPSQEAKEIRRRGELSLGATYMRNKKQHRGTHLQNRNRSADAENKQDCQKGREGGIN